MTRPDPAPQTEPLAPRRSSGRSFRSDRKVRLGDVDPRGRLRFDALTRYTQDVSDDDTSDAGMDPHPGWVVRSTVVDEVVPAGLGEWLRFETFCSGFGARWAERRLTVTGDREARYEVATVWVCVDAESGRPHRLTDQFRRLYAEAAGDRRISARLRNPSPPTGTDRLEPRRWQLRVVDFDIYDHVNNAAYWAALEQWLEPWRAPRRVRLEYGSGLERVDEVGIVVDRSEQRTALWWLGEAETEAESEGETEAEPAASALVTELPPGLYP